jgi:hypothetical protein
MKRVLLAVAVMAAAALFVPASPAGAGTACDPLNSDTLCFPTVEIAQFRADINNPAYTSLVVRPALLSLASVIELLYPTGPIYPYQAVVRATSRAVDGFAQAGLVTPTGRTVLLADLAALWPPVPI